MLQHTRQGVMWGKLIKEGVLWGIVAGVACALLVLIWAMLVEPPGYVDLEFLSFVSIGIFGATVVGAINGLVFGLVWNAVARKYPIDLE